MTPQEFQTLMIGWIGSLTAVAIALIGAGFAIYAAFKAKSAEIHSKTNKERLDRHGEAIRKTSQTVTQLSAQSAPNASVQTEGDNHGT